MTPLEVALVAFVVATALLAALFRDAVHTVVAFAAFSLGLALVWVLLAAPDVALAEAAVGAGVMSVLLLVTIARTTTGPLGEGSHAGGDGEERADEDGEERADGDELFHPLNVPLLATLVALAVPLAASVDALPPIGSPDAPAVSTVYADGTLTPYGYYLEHTLAETGISNAVAAVLIVYRGLDTFGEVIVAFGAAVGVLLVLGRDDLL